MLDDSPESQLLLARSCKIQAVRLDSITEQEDKGYEIKMRLVFSGEQKEYKKTLNLYFQKPAPPWIIQTDSVQGCFDKPS
jgi:hypothetical protein